MFRSIIGLLMTACLCAVLTGALQDRVLAQGATATIVNDCAVELSEYCSSITPGQGRKVACLISYSDKLSPRCRLTAFLAGKVIANSILTLEKMAFACGSDIRQYCEHVIPGGGRIYDCLRKKRAFLLDSCRNLLPSFEAMFMKK